MHRGKLRRLLASSSFAVILVAAEAARGQDLTNPPGTIEFLKVDPGETFDNVINNGLIANDDNNPGIEVSSTAGANAAVRTDIVNDGSILLIGTNNLTGILVHGTSATVGGRIRNEGIIDLEVLTSGTDQDVFGIRASGLNVEIGAVTNAADAIIDLNQINLGITAAGSASGVGFGFGFGDGRAAGIFVNDDVLLGGGVANQGTIAVDSLVSLSVTAGVAPAAIASVHAEGDAYGVWIETPTLPGGFRNEGDEALIRVKFASNATGNAAAFGPAAQAAALVTASAGAFGVGIDSVTINGGIRHEGLIDVENAAAAAATAIASASLGAATAQATAVGAASAFGIHADGNDVTPLALLTGGFEAAGTVLVDVGLQAKAAAEADAGTAGGSALAVVQAGILTTPLKAHGAGVQLGVDTITGDVVNDGRIEVAVGAIVTAKADAFSANGSANATLTAAFLAEAVGLDLGANIIDGDFDNAADVVVDARATGTAVAKAVAAGLSGNSATAKALILPAGARATGIALEASTLFGDLDNSGSIDVLAEAKFAVSAVATGPDFAHARAQLAKVHAGAVGLAAEGALDGDFGNDGDIAAVARLTAVGEAAAKVTSAANFAAASGVLEGKARATALKIAFDSIGGSFANDAALTASASAALSAGAFATNTGEGSAFAVASVLKAGAHGQGIFIEAATLGGGIANSGDILAGAQLKIAATASAKGASESGPLDDTALAIAYLTALHASAYGLQALVSGTAAGFENGAEISAGALLTITAGADAVANLEDAQAVVTVGGTPTPEIRAEARGLELRAGAITGDVVNHGGIAAAAQILVDAEARASGRRSGFALVLVDPFAVASGFIVSATALGGDVVNDGDILAQALLQIDGNGQAIVPVQNGSAVVTVDIDGRVRASGLIVVFDTLAGGFSNSGELTARATIDLQATAEAANTGLGSAFAHVDLRAEGSAFGLIVGGGSVAGDIVNSGDVRTRHQSLIDARATAEGADDGVGSLAVGALASLTIFQNIMRGSAVRLDVGTVVGDVLNSGQLSATALVTVLALADAEADSGGATAAIDYAGVAVAHGVSGELGTVFGDVLNSGGVAALAKAEAQVSAFADAADGGAVAVIGSTSNPASLTANAGGLGLFIGLLGGDFENQGVIVAVASAALRVFDGATGSAPVQVAAHGTSGATASADLAFRVHASGLRIEVDALNGNVANSGAIAAAARQFANLSVLAETTGESGDAQLLVHLVGVSATAYGAAGTALEGTLSNAGDLRAVAAASIHLRAAASATSQATATVTVLNLSVAAHGIDSEFLTIGGNVDNSGDISAVAVAFLSINAVATGGTTENNAKIVIPAGDDVAAEAVGIAVHGFTTIHGSILNSGSVRALAQVEAGGGKGGLVALASGDPAAPQVTWASAHATAAALRVEGIALGGEIVNDGTLAAAAALDLALAAKASAEFPATAVAKLLSAAAVATGLAIEVGTLSGQAHNQGSILAGAAIDLSLTALAHGIAGKAASTADAQVLGRSISAIAAGVSIGGNTVAGGVLNDGLVAAVASLAAAVSVTGSGSVSASPSAHLTQFHALARGYFLPVGGLSGGFANAGEILAQATMQVGAGTDPAVARAGTAGSVVKATLQIDGLRALAVGVELDSKMTTFGGGLANGGLIQAEAFASMAGSAQAEGSTAVKALVTVNDLSATARGVLLQASTVSGGMLNDGTIVALATVAVDIAASAHGTLSVSATAQTSGAIASAIGIFVQSGVALNDGVSNDGLVRAEARVNATAKAVATGFAGTANVAAVLPSLTAFAAGMVASNQDTISGGLRNSGRLDVSASVAGRVSAAGSAAKASIFAEAIAVGMGVINSTDVDLNGGMLNAGTVVARARAVAQATAAGGTVGGKALAQATGMALPIDMLVGDVVNIGLIDVAAFASVRATGGLVVESALAIAYGIRAIVSGSAVGDMINSGTILASAKATAPALAVGQAIEGTGAWSGALVNNGLISVFASDPVAATAAGMGIADSVIVAGGLENRGTILAEAVGAGALARAIDVTAATGTGHNIRMLDGRLEAFTRATPLATATNVGTAVAMQGNGQADALDWSGGAILADIVGDQGVDNLDVFAGVDDVLNFSAAIKGLATIDVNTAAQAATPIEFRVNGEVSDVQVLAVNQNGTLVVGPDAAISVAFYAQDAGGKVFFEINAPSNGPPANGGIFLALGASPDGTIGIRPLPGLYAETQSYLVIDGPLFSTFSGSVSNSPLLTLTVEQDSPDVVLHVARVPFDEVPGLQSENHGALVQVLEDLYDPDELGGTDLGEVVGALFGLNAEELSDAFDDLHGAEHAQMVYGGFEAAQFLSSGIGERLNDARGQAPGDGQGTEAPSLQYAEAGAADAQLAALGAYDPDRPASVWARGIGSFGTLDGDAEAPGYDRTTGAVVLGIDYRIDEAFLIGLAGAYAYSSFDFDDGDQGDINSFQIGLFGSWDSGTFYVDGLVSYAFQSYDTERTVDFGMVEGTAKGDYDGSAVQVYGEVGYQFQAGEQFLLQPLVGLGWTSVWTDSFTETGAPGANLTVDEARYDSLQTTLGARASLQLEGWVPSLFLGWRHEFLDDRAEADVAFAAAPDNQFTVIGSDIGSDSGLVGVGVLAELSEQFEAVVDYSGQFSGAGTSHTGSLGVRLKF